MNEVGALMNASSYSEAGGLELCLSEAFAPTAMGSQFVDFYIVNESQVQPSDAATDAARRCLL